MTLNPNTDAAYQKSRARSKGEQAAGYDVEQYANFDKNQQALYKSMFSHVGPDSYTARLAAGDESLFEEMERPAFRQFNELQGGLASRFSGMGMGGRRGSGFQNAANQQTADFASDLQSKRQNLRRQAIQDLMGMSGDLLGQKPYTRFLTNPEEKEPSGWESFAKGVLPIAGQAADMYFQTPGVFKGVGQAASNAI
jgi:hypothetical protein